MGSIPLAHTHAAAGLFTCPAGGPMYLQHAHNAAPEEHTEPVVHAGGLLTHWLALPV